MQGGARAGAGRKKKPVLVAPKLTKTLAQKLQADDSTELRWKLLRNVGGNVPDIGSLRLRFDVEKYIWDRAEGRPVQQVRLANPEGEKFQLKVDVTSARDKLVAALLG
jgi:hypothetical protein